ncbi:MAG: response regulator [Rhodopirellula sp.]|nr:response regulator [Rhodopirellula sp.]
MSSLSNILLDKEILLESGTNELEVLVFDVADYTFGVNVAKVREVLPAAAITALPQAHRSIRGVFKLRNQVIPCVSLLDYLGITPTREDSESTMILTDLNQQQTAFLVDAVERIHRLSWENILAVPGLDALSHTPVTALGRCDNRLVVMLDFEMILDNVTDQYFRVDEVANPLGLARQQLRIFLAEDSPTVREAVGNTLRASGYTQLTFFENGAEAWQTIEERLRQNGRIEDVCDLVIADIEMPQVDGLHLTRRIKQHPQLNSIPVLLYSSIITLDNHKKGVAVGADAQVSKPQLAEVVQLADQLISDARRGAVAAGLRQLTDAVCAAAPPIVCPSSSEASSSAVSSPMDITAPEPSPARAAELFDTNPTRFSRPAEDDCLVDDGASTALAEPAEIGQPGECVPPPNVLPELWQTFLRELGGHARRLGQRLAIAAAGGADDDVRRDVARTLHTIKSSSMVVPFDAVTERTHAVEGLLAASATDAGEWPRESLKQYADWLIALASSPEQAAATSAVR